MRHAVKRILRIAIVVGLIGAASAICQQQAPVPNAYRDRAVEPSRAAQYSPLAAQGGYRRQRISWYEALFHSLNPNNVDWGMRWEQRRNIFLENSVGNRYFVYTAGLSLLLIHLMVVIIWQRWDHAERLKELAQNTADAMNYGRYWKRSAVDAIRKHNDHVERCNRVIEAAESGVPVDRSAVDMARDLDRALVELANAVSDKKRAQAELEAKNAMIADLSARVDEVTRKMAQNGGGGKGDPTKEKPSQVAALVDRINRLESALEGARQEIRRLKG